MPGEGPARELTTEPLDRTVIVTPLYLCFQWIGEPRSPGIPGIPGIKASKPETVFEDRTERTRERESGVPAGGDVRIRSSAHLLRTSQNIPVLLSKSTAK